MKVTTKGQVTIPMDIREQLNIQPGAEVEFTIEGDGAKMIPVRNASKRGLHIVERMRGKATVKMSTDEILALTRGKA
jgi:antitoxin PrlF